MLLAEAVQAWVQRSQGGVQASASSRAASGEL